jgi:hypothetical protein
VLADPRNQVDPVDFSHRMIARVERSWEGQLGAERYAALLDIGRRA